MTRQVRSVATALLVATLIFLSVVSYPIAVNPPDPADNDIPIMLLGMALGAVVTATVSWAIISIVVGSSEGESK